MLFRKVPYIWTALLSIVNRSYPLNVTSGTAIVLQKIILRNVCIYYARLIGHVVVWQETLNYANTDNQYDITPLYEVEIKTFPACYQILPNLTQAMWTRAIFAFAFVANKKKKNPHAKKRVQTVRKEEKTKKRYWCLLSIRLTFQPDCDYDHIPDSHFFKCI